MYIYSIVYEYRYTKYTHTYTYVNIVCRVTLNAHNCRNDYSHLSISLYIYKYTAYSPIAGMTVAISIYIYIYLDCLLRIAGMTMPMHVSPFIFIAGMIIAIAYMYMAFCLLQAWLWLCIRCLLPLAGMSIAMYISPIAYCRNDCSYLYINIYIYILPIAGMTIATYWYVLPMAYGRNDYSHIGCVLGMRHLRKKYVLCGLSSHIAHTSSTSNCINGWLKPHSTYFFHELFLAFAFQAT